ncbi:hypothetical protein GCM10023085_28950 [Actinomadura viridis]|uniref:SurA-like protein n=2 Tax=Actinomadura viridis TaxID=58110 RepID=A0A931D9U2_9ACTN|nr:SurA N-terminal domain-containing protein [Actinomadura viridis]MBG6087119.1 hypothetical protein [Actinomadura viridis]
MAAAAVAAAALAGCGGGPVKVGTAAVVDDDRIELSTLDRAVQDWQREFRADERANLIRQRLGSDQLWDSDLREALDWLVKFRVAGEVAERNGLPVSEGQVDEVVAALDRQAGAASATRAYGLPARYTRDLARFFAVQTLAAQRFAGNAQPGSPQSAAAQEQTKNLFVTAARGMRITINPRFGGFDPAQVGLTPVAFTLSATESGIR